MTQKRLELCCVTQARFAEYRLFYRAVLQKRHIILTVLQKRPIILRRHAIWIVSDRCAFGESTRAPCLGTTHTHTRTYTHTHADACKRMWCDLREWYMRHIHISVCLVRWPHRHRHTDTQTLMNVKNGMWLTEMGYDSQKCEMTHSHTHMWLHMSFILICDHIWVSYSYVITYPYALFGIVGEESLWQSVFPMNIASFIGLFCKRDL